MSTSEANFRAAYERDRNDTQADTHNVLVEIACQLIRQNDLKEMELRGEIPA